MRPSARSATALIGAGRLARALHAVLLDAGYDVIAVASRRLSAARRLVRGSGGVATTDPGTAARDARLVLLAIPDGAIAGVARGLADDRRDWRGSTVLHHAGALGLRPLRPLARAGARVGVLHPLQSLGANRVAPTLLAGSYARVEGAPLATRLARDLGLIPLHLPAPVTPAKRAAYHAAASLLSNDLLALLAGGVELLESAGLRRRQALLVLAPLIRGTVAQATGAGLGAALTGPVVRGDIDTLEGHLRRLQRVSPDLAEAHRRLSSRLVDLARREGLSIPRDVERRIARLRAPGGEE